VDATDWKRLVLDLKTIAELTQEKFSRVMWKRRYHVQAAFYTDILLLSDITVKHFIFIAVEKKEPFSVVCYEPDNLAVLIGREEYHRDIATFKRCEQTDKWPGICDDSVCEISLPGYHTYAIASGVINRDHLSRTHQR
jgi:PDDEXK-like domain of unknown function (DUF3799)